MKIPLLFLGFLLAPLVLGIKTSLPKIDAVNIIVETKSEDNVNEIDNRNVFTPRLHKPYSFTDCIGDLKQVFLSLVNDVNESTFESQRMQSLTQGISERPDFLSYSFLSFTTQVLKICSPESVNEILPQLSLGLKNSEYPQICVIQSTAKENDCFEILQKITPMITVNKLAISPDLKKKAKLTESFLQDYKDQQSKKKLDKQVILSSSSSKVGRNKKNKILPTIITTTQLSIVTAAVPKTLYQITNQPSIVYLTITQLSQIVLTAFKKNDKVSTVGKVKGNVATTTVTDLLINLSVTTKLLKAETITVMYNNYSSSSNKDTNTESKVAAQVFNLFPRLSTVPVSLFANTTSTNPFRPIRSRLCDRITLFGLQCPFRTTTTVSTVEVTTENINININVKENRGNIKLLRNSATHVPHQTFTSTTMFTQTTSVTTTIATTIATTVATTIVTTVATTKLKKVTKLTTITDTVNTTKTKYKIVTQTQTQTKNPHDCDDETYEHDQNDSGLTEDDFFDDPTDYFVESNEDSKNDENASDIRDNRDLKDDPLIIYLAVNSTKHRYQTNSLKINDSMYIENLTNYSGEFIHFTNRSNFSNGSDLPSNREKLLKALSLITLLSFSLFL